MVFRNSQATGIEPDPGKIKKAKKARTLKCECASITYQLRDNEYVPFIETDAADAYREVALVAQPGTQEAFLAAPEREVLLAGPRGTGKTLNLLMDFFAEVGAGWGADWKGILIRQSMTGFPEIKSLCSKVIPRIWPNARFNQNQNVWTWPSGETLKLAYFDETSDYRTYIGQSFTWIGFEELTQYRNDQPYKQMLACLRSAVPNIPMRVRSTTNPDGPGHNWVRRRFQDHRSQRHHHRPAHRGRTRPAAPGDLRHACRKPTPPHHPARLSRQHRRIGDPPRPARGLDQGIMDDLVGRHVRRRLAGGIEALRAAADPAAADPAHRGGSRRRSIGAIQSRSPGFGRRSVTAPRSSYPAAACCISSAAITSSSTNSTAVIRTSLIPACAGPSIRSNALALPKKSTAGLRYQDPMTGRWIRRVRTGVADNMIFNPKPGSATRPCRQHGR